MKGDRFIRRQTPVELFESVRIHLGKIAEFDLGDVAPGLAVGRDFVALTLPGRGKPPDRHVAGGRVYVPHYEMSNESEDAQRAIDLTTADVYGEAWRLLLAAAGESPTLEGRDRQEVEALMRSRFAEVFRVGPGEVLVESYALNDDVVGVYGARKDRVVMTVHEEPTLWHLPPLTPVCWVECGFAVLDARVVLRGKVYK